MHVDQNDEHPWLDPEKELIRGRARPRDSDPWRLPGEPAARRGGGRPRLTGCQSRRSAGTRSRSPQPGAADPVVGPLAPRAELFEWHHYAAPLPPGAVELARTPACVQAFRIDGKPAWGLQFHAEVTRENLLGWLDGWEESEAVDTDLDPDEIRAASERRIEEQNEIGRGLAERFLAEAARA